MIYEYRCYKVLPGQWDRLHHRFEEVTLPLWGAHEIVPLAFFQPVVGVSNRLHYLLQWENMAEREEKWTRFRQDPRWKEGVIKSEHNGPIIESILNEFWVPIEFGGKGGH